MEELPDITNLIPLGLYTHYKGGSYRVIGVAYHSETLDKLVVYNHLNPDGSSGQMFVRPLEMFQGDVVVEGKTVKRFTLCSEAVC